ncbi:condensation domain-containing protein [Nocardia mangyaensis]|uniref:condensation domain-containing protein n=1 Tax=Nocardia mangyaensis TaxID=2213200 RepID=UPI002675C19A|nr:condensation domain-containing protein [Nocardia mangyaensis]MDO3648371.1 condensation domain-containing protein [Nocardia mangyaensis]
MHVTTVDRYAPEPGTFVHWTVRDDGTSIDSPVPASFNQLVHLAGVEAGNTWLAASFDVDGPLDRVALADAYRALIARHGTLRSSFVLTSTGPRRALRSASVRLEEQPGAAHRSSAALRDTLWRHCNDRCAPFAERAYLFAAIDRPDTATIVCAFDHAHVDAYSIAIVIEDLRLLYHGAALETLPPVGDFVDHCAQPVEFRDDDPRVDGWREFFGDQGVVPPSFPLDLGLEPGRSAPQAVELRRMLSAETAGEFESYCRANDSGVFAGVLAATAHGIRAVGGGDRVRLLFPMHTRHEPRWQHAVGWFTTNAPVAIDASGEPARTVRRAQDAVRAAIEIGTVPLAQTLRALGGLRLRRADIFMVSYLDYRRLPGADARNATHISNSSSADDVQIWFSRDDNGLSLRARYPATARARAVVLPFLDEVEQALRACAARGVLISTGPSTAAEGR